MMSDGINALKSNLPPTSWTEDASVIAPWLVEWRDKYAGQTPLMVMPASPEETSDIVKICAAHNFKIVPQGGNTGLVGGQTPQGEILLSTRRMNQIRDINVTTNTLTAEAGAILSEVQCVADQVERKFPLSLAAQDSCTIGGNIATNAGGVHVLKYGSMKDLVIGVEAVMPNGDIFNGLSQLRKDNTGYDLSRLFAGAEGTLGIITAASLKLFPKPGYIQRVMCAVESPAKALALLDHCRAGDKLSMFEVMPRIGLELVTTYVPYQRDPFTAPSAWYAVIDWEVDNDSEGQALAEQKLQSAAENNLITDAVIAQSEDQAADLLALRENMSAAQKGIGGSIKQDITLPIDKIPEFLDVAGDVMQKLVPGCRPVPFGHLGDGNIHYNIAQPENMDKNDFLKQWDLVSTSVFDLVQRMGGSISAEHGIGIMKREELAARADPVKISLLKTVKQALDPNNIMNPRVLIG